MKVVPPAAGPRKSALFDVDKGRMPETELWKWQGSMSPQFSTVILEYDENLLLFFPQTVNR